MTERADTDEAGPVARPTNGPKDAHRVRTAIAGTLFAVATLVSVTAWWGQSMLDDTDRYTSTAGDLINRSEFRQALAARISAEVVTGLDSRLPLDADARSSLRTRLTSGLVPLLKTQAVRDLWRDGNREAHASLGPVLDGRPTAAQRRDAGVITIAAAPLVADALETINVPATVRDAVLDAAGDRLDTRTRVLSASTVDDLQGVHRALVVAGRVAPVVAVLALVVSLLAPDRRLRRAAILLLATSMASALVAVVVLSVSMAPSSGADVDALVQEALFHSWSTMLNQAAVWIAGAVVVAAGVITGVRKVSGTGSEPAP